MKKSDGLLLLGSVIFIAFLSLGTFLLPDKAFSENENRYLQEAPELSLIHISLIKLWFSNSCLSSFPIFIKIFPQRYLCRKNRTD